MKKLLSKALFTLLCVCALIIPSSAAQTAMGVAAYPDEISIIEPATGQSVSVYNNGSMAFDYMTDANGRVLVFDADGYVRGITEQDGVYYLAEYVTGQLPAPSVFGVPVISANISADEYNALCEEIDAAKPQIYSASDRISDIPYAYDYVGDAAEGRVRVCSEEEGKQLTNEANYPEKTDKCPLLVLRVEYNDITGTFSDTEWHDNIFGEGGVSDYYTEVSNDKFTYVPAEETSGTANDGVITVKLPFNVPVYAKKSSTNQNTDVDVLFGLYSGTDGKNYAVYGSGSIFAYALMQAEDSIDFAVYDRNNDGIISPTELSVVLVSVGYDASYSLSNLMNGKLPGVWPHSGTFDNGLANAPEGYTAHIQTITVDEKQFFGYTTIAEVTNIPFFYDVFTHKGSPAMATIGTVTHELGHALGLRDLYNTGSTDTSAEVGLLSLMADGSGGRADSDATGSSPTHLDPYSKIFLGFYDSEVSANGGEYTLYAAGTSDKYNILRINTDNPDVYYLLENREDVGFDVGLERKFSASDIGGVVIWRIDEAVLREAWNANTINNTEGRYGIMTVFVSPDTSISPFWNKNVDEEALESLKAVLPVSFTSEKGLEMTLEMLQTLTFTKSAAYDIPALTANTPITPIDVSDGVTGGAAPYTFSLSNAPSWLSISETGVLTGTPGTESAAFDAVITVTDAHGDTASITVSVSALTAPSSSEIPSSSEVPASSESQPQYTISSIPQTGDTATPSLWAVLALLSLAGITIAAPNRAKKK